MAELIEENGDEDDPHRLLDYSLDGAYDQAPYLASDLDLAWVESQDGSQYSYGLVDAAGAWLIPLGKRHLSVRPFRHGIAEVIINEEPASYVGPWMKMARRVDRSAIGPPRKCRAARAARHQQRLPDRRHHRCMRKSSARGDSILLLKVVGGSV